MRKFEFPVAPMVLATVLAKLMETSFTQSLVMSKGSPLILFTPLVSGALIMPTLTSGVSGIPKPRPSGSRSNRATRECQGRHLSGMMVV
jgi:TctA family transporter